jgi:hypothetical protein
MTLFVVPAWSGSWPYVRELALVAAIAAELFSLAHCDYHSSVVRAIGKYEKCG